MGLQQFGVISFEIRTLMYCHTEQRRTQRFYIAEIVRHRGTVGAWRNRGYLRVLLMLWSNSLQSSSLQYFLKCLLPKLSATRTLRLCRSLCLRHLRDIVFMFSPPCSPPLCVPFICSRLTLSLYISEEPKICIGSNERFGLNPKEVQIKVKELENNLYICSRLAW